MTELTLLDRIRLELRHRTMPKDRTSWLYYLGGLALFFLAVQLVTGLLLLCYYIPTPEAAHASVRKIISWVPYGAQIRSIHIWSSHAMVLFAALHLAGLFVMRTYQRPYVALWISWVLFLFVTLAAAYTGSVLPWDHQAYSAARIGTDLVSFVPLLGDWISQVFRGGSTVGSATITRYFALHAVALPMLLVLIAFVHTSMALLLGRPRTTGPSEPFWPGYVLKELTIWLVALAVLVALGFLLIPELGPAYDLKQPVASSEGLSPEWYFIWIFQLLNVLPEWMTVTIVLALAALIFTIPAIDRNNSSSVVRRILTFGLSIMGGIILSTIALAYFSKG